MSSCSFMLMQTVNQLYMWQLYSRFTWDKLVHATNFHDQALSTPVFFITCTTIWEVLVPAWNTRDNEALANLAKLSCKQIKVGLQYIHSENLEIAIILLWRKFIKYQHEKPQMKTNNPFKQLTHLSDSTFINGLLLNKYHL